MYFIEYNDRIFVNQEEEEIFTLVRNNQEEKLQELLLEWRSKSIKSLSEKYNIEYYALYKKFKEAFGKKGRSLLVDQERSKLANKARWGDKVVLTKEEAQHLPKWVKHRAIHKGVSLKTIEKYGNIISN